MGGGIVQVCTVGIVVVPLFVSGFRMRDKCYGLDCISVRGQKLRREYIMLPFGNVFPRLRYLDRVMIF